MHASAIIWCVGTADDHMSVCTHIGVTLDRFFWCTGKGGELFHSALGRDVCQIVGQYTTSLNTKHVSMQLGLHVRGG